MFDLHLDPLKDLRVFFQLRSEALLHASSLLGGKPGLHCLQALIDDLEIQPKLTRRMERNLIRLHKLLTLQNVHDLDRIEAHYFAEIDPATPVVEELCLLSDEFTEHLQEYLAVQAEAPFALLSA